MAHFVPLLVVVLYLVALFAATWWARRLTARGGGGMVGYLLAGRGLPTVVVASLLAGLAVGGASTIGVAERAYTVGPGPPARRSWGCSRCAASAAGN